MSDLTPAQRLVEEGRACSNTGDLAGAEQAYLSAAALDPDWSVPVFNLGLLYKYQGRWDESLEFNRLASDRSPDDQGAWWNCGIAATALGRWPEARRYWTKCGIADPGGPDPPDYRFGRIPLRLDPDGDGEVVWGSRLHEHDEVSGAPAHPHCGLVAPSRDLARAILDQWLELNSVADLVTWYEHSVDGVQR